VPQEARTPGAVLASCPPPRLVGFTIMRAPRNRLVDWNKRTIEIVPTRGEAAAVRALVARLRRARRHPVPKAGGRLACPSRDGVYLILDPAGRVGHVGRTTRARRASSTACAPTWPGGPPSCFSTWRIARPASGGAGRIAGSRSRTRGCRRSSKPSQPAPAARCTSGPVRVLAA